MGGGGVEGDRAGFSEGKANGVLVHLHEVIKTVIKTVREEPVMRLHTWSIRVSQHGRLENESCRFNTLAKREAKEYK